MVEQEKNNSVEEEAKDNKEVNEENETTSPEVKQEELEQKIEKLQEEIESLEAEKDKYLSKLKRAQADFANYKRRISRERADLAVRYKVEVIEEILPVLDNFERALATEMEDYNLSQGVEMIYRQLWTVLEQEGVQKIDAVGDEFDHKYHEAIEQVEADAEAGTVVEEVQPGYMFADIVIRPAMVKIAG
ncbi:MAG: nucleotide exchange factor GrpE [Bacillota bacterium]